MRSLLLIVGAWLSLASPVVASTLTTQDYLAFTTLLSRSLTLSLDINSSGKGAALERLRTGNDDGSTDCLDELISASTDYEDKLSNISDLVGLESMMSQRNDSTIILTFLRINVEGFVKVVGLSRSSINKAAGQCGNSALVQSKSQLMLAFLDELSIVVRRLQNKIGA